MVGLVDDDKVDYRASPVRTHLQMTPSEEHVLPERQQVLEEYEQAAWKSNRQSALRTSEREVPRSLDPIVSV